jgi:hypothetical protein
VRVAVSRLARRTLSLAETRWGVGAVLVAALAVWWVQAYAISLTAGRDFNTYIGAYAQLFDSEPIDLGYTLGRTPVAPVVAGGLLDFADGALAEPAVSVLYALSITAWFVAARRWGPLPAVVSAVVLLAYPSYGILFHELSSDLVFAAAFAGWSLLAVRVLLSPTLAGFAAVGAGVGVLALVRPANQTLLLLAVVALAVPLAWGRRLALAGAFVVPALAVVGAWTLHNGIRYDVYALSRAGNANVPFYRVFIVDRIVEPDNGSSSRALASAVRSDLIPEEPYRSYQVTYEEFFAEPTPRMWADLMALSDARWGWHSHHRILREVAVEAIRAHPVEYASGVADTTWQLLYQPLFWPLGGDGGGDDGRADEGRADGGGETVVIGGKRLPKPTEGEAIPSAHESAVTTPDGSIRTVWTSPTEHHLVFDHPGDEERYLALHRRLAELRAGLPDRRGNATLALRLNQASRWYVPPLVFLLVGIVAAAVRRPRNVVALAFPALAGLVVIVISALGLPAIPHYSVPVAPAFVLLAAGAVFGPRAGRTDR